MDAPTRADYVRYYSTLFDRFEQAQPTVSHRGRPFTYAQRLLIVLFTACCCAASPSSRPSTAG